MVVGPNYRLVHLWLAYVAIKLKYLIYNIMKPQFREELKEVARQYGANKENFEYEVSCQEGSTVTCSFKIAIGSS